MIRVGLLERPTIPLVAVAASVVVETLTMMTVGAALAAGYLFFQAAARPQLLLLAMALLCLAGLPTLPPVLRAVILRTARVATDRQQLEQVLPRINYRLLLGGWALNAVGWLFLAASLWAVMAAVTPSGMPSFWRDLPEWVARVALAMVAGFLSLLPGGVLVRDAVLIEMLQERFGPVLAILGAVLLRLVWLAAELVMAALLFLASRLVTWSQPVQRRETEES